MARGRPRKTKTNDALHAAMIAFWQKGFVGTSMNDLAEASGMAKPGLYSAFGDKEQLYEKALLYYFNTYGLPVFKRMGAAEKHYVEDIREMLMAIAEFTSDQATPSGCFAVNAQVDMAYSTDRLRELVQSLRDSRMQALKERLYKAVKAGQLPKDADAHQIATYIDGQFTAVAMLGRVGAGLEDLKTFVDTAVASLPVADAFNINERGDEPIVRQ